MQLVLFLSQVKAQLSGQAGNTEFDPFLQYTDNTQKTGSGIYKHIEIAAEFVLERCLAVKLCHKLIRVCASCKVKSKFEAVKVYFVAHILDFLELTLFYHIHYLFHNSFYGCGIRYLYYVYAVVFTVIGIAGAKLYTAVTCFEYFLHAVAVIKQHGAAGKIGRFYQRHHFVNRNAGIFQQRDGTVADFCKVKRTYV